MRSIPDCIYSAECINKQYTQSHHRWSQFTHTPSSSLLLLKQMPTALTCPLQVITTIDNSVRLYNIPFPPSLHNNHNYIGWKIASQVTIHFLFFFLSFIYLQFTFSFFFFFLYIYHSPSILLQFIIFQMSRQVPGSL